MAKPIDFYSECDYSREVPDTGERSSFGESYRSDFRKDYARLLHSPSFRRLQRKTQLFPNDESDFFRNRITHSLEVAQIAKSITLSLNKKLEDTGYGANCLDTDLVEFAALAHDLGHPPFGHTGEFVLDELMRSFGGFEGNAQTLRILSRLEKKRTKGGTLPFYYTEFIDGQDMRAGLNLTSRALASVIKYDHEIGFQRRNNSEFEKGYYRSEANLIARIKQNVAPDIAGGEFKTIEMQIMDIADDIAYSTYDLEDALKAGFTSPLAMMGEVNGNDELRHAVAKKLFKSRFSRIFTEAHSSDEDRVKLAVIKEEMDDSFAKLWIPFLNTVHETAFENYEDSELESTSTSHAVLALSAVMTYKLSSMIQSNGYHRVEFTSDLISKRIRAIDIEVNETRPALSKLVVDPDCLFQIDVLKHLTYELHIKSHRLRVVESRGRQIITALFNAFKEDLNGDLLPPDWRERLRGIQAGTEIQAGQMRLICDYIAGMTDAYALETYARLYSSSPSRLFAPY